MLVSLEFIRSGGVSRTYIACTPPPFRRRPSARAVVVALHGHYGSGSQFRDQTQLDRWVDSDGVAVVYPDGERKTWKAGPGNDADAMSSADVAFLSVLVDRLRTDLQIKASQVFACGFSRGAVMVARFAATTAGKVAAIYTVGATQSYDWSSQQPAGWVAPRVCHIHGAADPISPAGGGMMPEGYRAWSVAEHQAWWQARANGGDVLVGTVPGGGHDWYGPGVRPTLPGGVDVGPTLAAPDLSEQALRWFGLLG